jgi:DNA-binding NtrC family response regulator
MSRHTRTSTLLLIDDDPDMVRLLTRVIERSMGSKLRVEACTDPEQARQRIDDGGIDILLTDLEMPSIDGLTLLRYAKKRSAFTQVLFITGHSSHEALLEALEQGSTDYLLKPVDQQKLVDLIEQAFHRQQRWREALGATWQQRQQAHA